MAISLDERSAAQPTQPPAPVSSAAAGARPASSQEPASSPEHPREHFWNLPNTITVLRTAALPVLLLYPLYDDPGGSRFVAWVFIVAALTDLLDGWLARRGKQVTSIGKLLDPLADKLLAATALIVLLAMDRIPLWATWMVVVIVGRELAVTGLRGLASAGGHVLAASWLGKLKTLTQNIAIGALLFHFPQAGIPAHEVGMAFLFLSTAVTLASGYLYFADYFREHARAGREDGRR
jgi:CDP-diacylglycerol--glycerol-3-phosphate 3-phosphatidyltransferase